MKNLKGLIIGCGSIGIRHLHNLKKLGLNELAIFDIDKKLVNGLSLKYKTKKFYDLNSALSFEPDFSVICTYPNLHLKIAKQCINSNSHLFIEKPISSNIRGTENMLRKAKSKKLKIAVGYNFRFEKGLKFLKEKSVESIIETPLSASIQFGNNIKFWRPGKNYKEHYILKKDGGIILDDSHEYDYLRWLLQDEVKSVYCQTRKITSIKTQTESIAAIILKFKKGTIANLLLDYVRPKHERSCNIIGEKGEICWQYFPSKGSWKNYNSKAFSKIIINFTLNKASIIKNFSEKTNDMYVSELRDFIKSITDNREPLVNGFDALKTLQIGIAALKSAESGKVIHI